MPVGIGGGTGVRAERRPVSVPPVRDAAREPDEPEVLVARLHRSGRALIWPGACFLAICFGSAWAAARLPHLRGWPWLTTALPIAAAGLVVMLSLLPLLFWLNRRTVLTTQRVIVTQGFVVRERTEVELARVTGAALRRGPAQLLFGSGDVIVRAGAEGELWLRDLPRARQVHRAIAQLIDRG